MALDHRAVDCPLHAAEHGEVDGMLLRAAFDLGQQGLYLKPVLQVVDVDLQLADKLGQRL